MPSREESAAGNPRQAIREAKGDCVVEWIERGVDGYFVLFRKEAVLEDGPATDAIRKLAHKLNAAFGQT